MVRVRKEGQERTLGVLHICLPSAEASLISTSERLHLQQQSRQYVGDAVLLVQRSMGAVGVV